MLLDSHYFAILPRHACGLNLSSGYLFLMLAGFLIISYNLLLISKHGLMSKMKITSEGGIGLNNPLKLDYYF